MRSYLFVSVGLLCLAVFVFFFFFQAEDGIRDSLCDWSSDVCSSDLDCLSNSSLRLLIHETERNWCSPMPNLLKQLPNLNSCSRACFSYSLPLPASTGSSIKRLVKGRSEERRVGKECRYS